MIKRSRYLKRAGVAVVLLLVVVGVFVSQRGYRLASLGYDLESQLRYLIDDGGTIGASPAAEAFADRYLELIFGHNQQLLDGVRDNIRRGVEADPDLLLGEVAALVVTYREDEDRAVMDVAVHVIGGFPLGRMAPQFHPGGFFQQNVDENLWDVGNTALRFAGREMILLAEEDVAATQADILEGIFSGYVDPLLAHATEPVFYMMVLPNPRQIVPPQLRHHISAIVYEGALSLYAGRNDIVLVTDSRRAASYVLGVINDLKRAAELALQTRFGGVEYEAEWGIARGPWWSYEMAQTAAGTSIERDGNLVRITSEFERVMVNAIIKSIERFGRDWRRKRMIMEDGVDPLEFDRQMTDRAPGSYWPDDHRWGPDAPIAPSAEELRLQAAEAALSEAQRELEQAQAQLRRDETAAHRARERRAELETVAAREAATEDGISTRTAAALQVATAQVEATEAQQGRSNDRVATAQRAIQAAENEFDLADRALTDAREMRRQRVMR